MRKIIRIIKFQYLFLAIILSIGYIIGAFIEGTLDLPSWEFATRVAIGIIASLANIVFLICAIIYLIEPNAKSKW